VTAFTAVVESRSWLGFEWITVGCFFSPLPGAAHPPIDDEIMADKGFFIKVVNDEKVRRIFRLYVRICTISTTHREVLVWSSDDPQVELSICVIRFTGERTVLQSRV